MIQPETAERLNQGYMWASQTHASTPRQFVITTLSQSAKSGGALGSFLGRVLGEEREPSHCDSHGYLLNMYGSSLRQPMLL